MEDFSSLYGVECRAGFGNLPSVDGMWRYMTLTLERKSARSPAASETRKFYCGGGPFLLRGNPLRHSLMPTAIMPVAMAGSRKTPDQSPFLRAALTNPKKQPPKPIKVNPNNHAPTR